MLSGVENVEHFLPGNRTYISSERVRSKKCGKKSQKNPLKIGEKSKSRHKLAASSFCVYLFGLESLAANSEGFLFYPP